MTDNLRIWDKVRKPPKEALKKIKGGRISGMTDISPQWRIKAMTEVYGPCGEGWKYEILRQWTEPGSEGQVFAFVNILLYTKDTAKGWSAPIPGTGGSMLITMEKSGLYSSDEAFKMATTDALSVAMKALGVAADIYMGMWDGDKYNEPPKPPEPITPSQVLDIDALISEVGADREKFLRFFQVSTTDDIPASRFKQAITMLEKKRNDS